MTAARLNKRTARPRLGSFLHCLLIIHPSAGARQKLSKKLPTRLERLERARVGENTQAQQESEPEQEFHWAAAIRFQAGKFWQR